MTYWGWAVALVGGVLAERASFRVGKWDMVPFIRWLQGNSPPVKPQPMNWLKPQL
jgi:hypothetical protein